MYRAVETYRGVAYPWSMDHMGHMNVASYTGRFDEATKRMVLIRPFQKDPAVFQSKL